MEEGKKKGKKSEERKGVEEGKKKRKKSERRKEEKNEE